MARNRRRDRRSALSLQRVATPLARGVECHSSYRPRRHPAQGFWSRRSSTQSQPDCFDRAGSLAHRRRPWFSAAKDRVVDSVSRFPLARTPRSPLFLLRPGRNSTKIRCRTMTAFPLDSGSILDGPGLNWGGSTLEVVRSQAIFLTRSAAFGPRVTDDLGLKGFLLPISDFYKVPKDAAFFTSDASGDPIHACPYKGGPDPNATSCSTGTKTRTTAGSTRHSIPTRQATSSFHLDARSRRRTRKDRPSHRTTGSRSFSAEGGTALKVLLHARSRDRHQQGRPGVEWPLIDFGILLLLLPSFMTVITIIVHRIRMVRQRRKERAPELVVLGLPCLIWRGNGQPWEKVEGADVDPGPGNGGSDDAATSRPFAADDLESGRAGETIPLLAEDENGAGPSQRTAAVETRPVNPASEVDDWLVRVKKLCPICKRDITVPIPPAPPVGVATAVSSPAAADEAAGEPRQAEGVAATPENPADQSIDLSQHLAQDHEHDQPSKRTPGLVSRRFWQCICSPLL
ncbi:hypothetical protein L1887_58442 [Cichorium endivia]|nr:hypothetical protein L1887_58442 [Cichorium endivia]